MPRRGKGAALRARKEPAQEGNEGRQLQQPKRVDGARQDLLKAIVSKSPAKTTAALCQQLKTVREKARTEIDHLQKTLGEKEEEILFHRERAEKAKRSLQSVEDRFARERLENETLETEIKEQTGALATALAINKGLKHVIASRRRDEEALEAWDDEGCPATELINEMIAFSVVSANDHIIAIECISDVAGSEGIIMELAFCDMLKACTGACDHAFLLSQQINFEADASEGLAHMHSAGVIHCDHKPQNVLICRCDGRTGFVAKITDPGLWCGWGEMRGKMTGTPGWIPLENVLDDVLAAPVQDIFASAVNACFVVTRDNLKTKSGNMWSHSSLLIPEEVERLRKLKAEGRDSTTLWQEIYKRVMLDGSFFSKFLKPVNLDPTLPPSELANVCDILKKALSGDPMDRPKMTAFTVFLRNLAWDTAEHEREIIALPPGIDLAEPGVPVISSSSDDSSDDSSEDTSSEGTVSLGGDSARGVGTLPRVAAPHAEEGGIDAGAGASAAAVPPPGEAAVEAEDGPALAPLAIAIDPSAGGTNNEIIMAAALDEIAPPVVPSIEGVHLAHPPPIVVAPHAEQAEQVEEHDNGAGAAAVPPPGEAVVEAEGDTASKPLAVAVNPPAEAANNAIIMLPALEEISPPVVPSIEPVHLAHPPPIVVAPPAEQAEQAGQHGDGAGAAAVPPPGEATVEAEGGTASTPLAVAVNPPAEAANNAIIMLPALEEISPPVVPSIEPVHPAPPPPIVVAPHAEQAEQVEEHDDSAGAVAVPPPAEATVEAEDGTASALPDVDVDPSVEAANNAVIMPPAPAEVVPPVVPSTEGVHLAHPPVVNNAVILPDLDETAPPAVPAMKQVQLAHPPPVVAAPHTEQAEQAGEDDDGAGAAAMPPPSEASVEEARSELAMHGSTMHAEHAEEHAGGADTVAAVPPPAEAAVQAATSNSAMHGPAPPPVVHPFADAESADEGAESAMDDAVVSAEGEIGGRLSLAPNPLLLRPFPGSPAEIMATYVAGTLRTPLGSLAGFANVPLAPAGSRPLAGQENRGGGCVDGVGGVLSGGGVVSGGNVLSGGDVVGGGSGDGGGGGGGGGRRFGGGRVKGKGRWRWWR